jgi:hypothetical protein
MNIDVEKRKIESRYIKPIRAIFRQMNQDAINLYKATKSVNAESVAKNYTPDFLKICKDCLRETIYTFGYLERKPSKKAIDAEINQDQLENINKEFERLAIFFIATESERQALYIQNTNAKELSEAQINALTKNIRKEARLQTIIQELEQRIMQIRFQGFIQGRETDLSKLDARLTKYKKELAALQKNKDNAVAEEINIALDKKEESRAELIAETLVGSGESWSRQEEATLIALNLQIQIKKTWRGILDGRIRENHYQASGQTVALNQNFIVGGYLAQMPRDSRLPASESLRCRCYVEYLKT